MSKNMVGLEIGNYSVKLIYMANGVAKKALAAPLPDGMVKNGEIISMEAMAEFLTESLKKVGIPRGSGCSVVLPDSLAFSKLVSLPAMTHEQLQYNLPYEFKDYVTEEKGHYFYDYAVQQIRPNPDGKDDEMTLFACAAQKATIAAYRSMLKQAGLKLKLAAPEACAYSAILSRADGDAECGIIDLGHKTTKIYIFKGRNYVAHRSMDIGVADVIRAVAESENVDEHMAGNYVRSNYKGILSDEPCTEVYGRIAVEVMKAVNFYNFNYRDNGLNTAYLLGGGTEIKPLTEAVTQALDLDIRMVNALLPGLSEDAQPRIFAKAAGITMQD